MLSGVIGEYTWLQEVEGGEVRVDWVEVTVWVPLSVLVGSQENCLRHLVLMDNTSDCRKWEMRRGWETGLSWSLEVLL